MLLRRLPLVLALLVSAAGTAWATLIPPNAADPNLQLWFKADSINGVANGGPVSTWADSSGYSNNLVASAMPTYVAGSPGTLNGEPYVQFGGGTYMQTVNNVDASLTGDLSTTVFLVLAPGTGSSATFGWGSPNSAGALFGLLTGYEGSNVPSLEYAGSTPAIFSSYTPNAFQIMEIQKSPGAINTTSSFSVNGIAQAIQGGSSAATPAVAVTPFYLGQWSNYGGFQLIGGVAEVLVYNSVLSPSDSAGIESYLNQKYFAPVPEPATLGSMLFGALLLHVVHRQKLAWNRRGMATSAGRRSRRDETVITD